MPYSMNKIRQHIKWIVVTLLAAVAIVSCTPDWIDEVKPDLTRGSGNYGEREINEETRKVMLLYSAGFNSLASYLKDDIEDLKKGYIPLNMRTSDVVLIYSHFPIPGEGYKTQSSPTLVRLHKGIDSVLVADTLVIYPEGTVSASAEQIHNVLSYINKNFRAKSYGMIFSSHATGYLPAGYYLNPTGESGDISWMSAKRQQMTVVPYIEPEYDPSLPMVKSIGQDQVGTYGDYVSYEINLDEFADAIPMHLDYLLFDACLMGGIEVAYELKDKVGRVGFSQTEVLAEGFCYESLTKHLLGNRESDPESVCRDFFNQYDIQSSVYRSATISLIDCSRLSPLAEVCKDLFEKYSDKIKALDHRKVQKFFRSNKHWFYDLESILLNAGISPEEEARLHDALDECVVYKAHTPEFMSEFTINTFSGFSMYLPNQGSEDLNKFYKSLKWNQDTGLVN